MELMKDFTAEAQRIRRETPSFYILSLRHSAKTPRLCGEKIITGNLVLGRKFPAKAQRARRKIFINL